MKTAAVIRHVHFEDLGTFEEPLTRAGYEFQYYDAGVRCLPATDPASTDLLTTRLKAGRPTFGICLGAQLIAGALGAKVYPSAIKEIGWGPVDLTDAGSTTSLRHLANTPVLHWHSDSFDLPKGATYLASTAICRNQAFCVGSNILGVQFHPEVSPVAGIEPWLVGHAVELSSA